MQVMKEIHAWEIFTCSDIDREVSDRIYQEILNSRRNIVLTGMSLAGKTTLGTLISEKLGRRLEDTDLMIIDREKREITNIFATDGEPYFRDLEAAMCRELAGESGIVIATGGGAILREENVDALKKNGYWGDVRERYLEKKNLNDDPDKHSRSIYAETINEIYRLYLNDR